MPRIGFSSAGKGGITKLSELIIDATKDWAAQDITNLGSLTATALHGTTYWGDIFFEDVECAVCHKRFKKGDKITLEVNVVEKKHISAVPIHEVCCVC